MNQIEIIGESGELVFNTRFYGKGAIEKAALDYKDVCDTEILEEVNNRVIVRIFPKTDEIGLSTICHEFYNYVLGLMQNAVF